MLAASCSRWNTTVGCRFIMSWRLWRAFSQVPFFCQWHFGRRSGRFAATAFSALRPHFFFAGSVAMSAFLRSPRPSCRTMLCRVIRLWHRHRCMAELRRYPLLTVSRLAAVGGLLFRFVIGGASVAIAVAIMTHMLLDMDALPALPGIVAIIGGIVCLVLLQAGRVASDRSQPSWLRACRLHHRQTFTRISRQPSRRMARCSPDRFKPICRDLHERHPACCNVSDISHRSLVYYLGHSVQRLSNPETISAFFARRRRRSGDASRSYEKHRQRLPSDLTFWRTSHGFSKSANELCSSDE